MKKLLLTITIIFGFISILNSQKVDSIKVEQAGDFIKIRYKIVNSSMGQMYRVKIQFTINGGLRQEPRTISGDVGEQVAGGKSEYWALWDVLKDIDELKSVEFYVIAELVNKSPVLSSDKTSSKKNENPTGWNKKGFHVFVDLQAPGPKFGAMIGYSRAVGIMMKYVQGKTGMGGDVQSGVPAHVGPATAYYSTDLTVRIINIKGFQMHIAAGLAMSQFEFSENIGPGNYRFFSHNLKGVEAGFIFDIKRIAIIGSLSHFDPKSVESGNSGNIRCWSNRTFYDLGVGVRF
jgi:hypothetical protein